MCKRYANRRSHKRPGVHNGDGKDDAASTEVNAPRRFHLHESDLVPLPLVPLVSPLGSAPAVLGPTTPPPPLFGSWSHNNNHMSSPPHARALGTAYSLTLAN
ncbi:hypothetical protein FRC08_007720 [Ceratobasidium sp. 394]|nr:hypothetical protein FRC08_007720 [Ceratobasidium sp. 394]